jgi:predicted RNase H-like HicB family nuclease
MKPADRYLRIVEWSDEDNVFIGSCPELFGGGCHGTDPRVVFEELSIIIEEWIEIYEQDGRPLPEPMANKRLHSVLHTTAA